MTGAAADYEEIVAVVTFGHNHLYMRKKYFKKMCVCVHTICLYIYICLHVYTCIEI